MKHCPDPDCRHRKQHGRPAEYRDDIETCPECGARLVGEEPPEPVPTAAPPIPASLWWRLGVTLIVPLAVLILERVPLPWVDEELMRDAHGPE